MTGKIHSRRDFVNHGLFITLASDYGKTSLTQSKLRKTTKQVKKNPGEIYRKHGPNSC